MATSLFSTTTFDSKRYICPFDDGECDGMNKCQGMVHASTTTDSVKMPTTLPPYLWCVVNSYLMDMDDLSPFTTVVSLKTPVEVELSVDQCVLSYDYGKEVEKEYSDPDITTCVLRADEEEEAEIQIDFQKELLTHKRSGGVFEIKRLGTPSPLLFRTSPKAAGWVWYWQSDDPERNWSELDYLHVSVDDDYWPHGGTLEKAFLTKNSERIEIEAKGNGTLLPFSVDAAKMTMFDEDDEPYDLRRRPALFTTFVEWCYLDDSKHASSGAQWVTFGDLNAYGDTRFPPVTSEMLENQFLTKRYTLECGIYQVDLQRKNMSWSIGPDWKREMVKVPIRRDVFSGPQLIPLEEFPKTWDPMPKSRIYITVALPPNTPEYNLVEDLIKKTVPQNISLIRRIQNPATYKSYVKSKKAIASLYPRHELKEEWLFHGTADVKINQICERNFDPSLAGSAHGTRYGKGTYFARDASHSLGFAGNGRAINRRSTTIPDLSSWSKKANKLLVCKVLIGPKIRGKNELTVKEQPFSTMVDALNDSSVFVNPEPHSFRPEYIVEFELEATGGMQQS